MTNVPYQTPPAWQPTPPRPPLTPRLKRGAALAGAVGFAMLGFGWSLVAIALGFAFFASLFSFVMGMADRMPEGRDAEFREMLEFFESIDVSAWVVPIIIAGILGAIIMVAALFVSRGILQRSGHPNAWGVTWAGAGIGIVATWIVGWIAALPGQLIWGAMPQTGSVEAAIPAIVISGVVSLVLSLAINAVIGWLSWWWMAHAMRPAAAVEASEG